MTDLSTAIDRGVEALIGMQDDDGWWKGVLDTNVTLAPGAA